MAQNLAEQAEKKIREYMYGSLAVGAVPIPIVDLVALSGIQLRMLRDLSELYHFEFNEEVGKSFIGALLGGTVPVSLSRNLASLMKGLPFGQITGMISMSLFAGASTYAIGKVFVEHFESGKTFLSFDPKPASEYYVQELEKCRNELHKWKKP